LDPFPLELPFAKAHIFEVRPGFTPEGVQIYEVGVAGKERLPDGNDYVILETRTRPRASSSARAIGREWLRRDGSGIVCARRQEGPTISDLEPVQRFLRLPLLEGDSWKWSGRAGGLPCTSETTVVSRERVTVPEGTHEGTWRLDTTTRSDNGDVLTRSIRIAPGFGLIEEESCITASGRTLKFDARLLREVEPGKPSVTGKTKHR